MTTILLLVLTSSAHADPAANARCHVLVGMTDEGTRLDELEVETGTVRSSLTIGALDVSGVRGLARTGNTLLLCSQGELQTLGLTDGTVSPTGVPCEGLGGGDALVVLATGVSDSTVYRDPAALVAGVETPSEAAVLLDPHVAVAYGDSVLTASHATANVRVRSPADGTVASSLRLEGVDAPIWGMSVVDDVLYVLDDGRDEDTRGPPELLAFTLAEGTPLGSVPLDLAPGEVARGLHCTAP